MRVCVRVGNLCHRKAYYEEGKGKERSIDGKTHAVQEHKTHDLVVG